MRLEQVQTQQLLEMLPGEVNNPGMEGRQLVSGIIHYSRLGLPGDQT